MNLKNDVTQVRRDAFYSEELIHFRGLGGCAPSGHLTLKQRRFKVVSLLDGNSFKDVSLLSEKESTLKGKNLLPL